MNAVNQATFSPRECTLGLAAWAAKKFAMPPAGFFEAELAEEDFLGDFFSADLGFSVWGRGDCDHDGNIGEGRFFLPFNFVLDDSIDGDVI